MHTVPTRLVAASSIVLACGLLLAPLSNADITSATYINPTLFHYRVQHMPDIDQRRSSLPCGGSIHCVPTATINLMMYAANHGFEDVQPGPGFWEGNSRYIDATNAVFFMGGLMSTSCASGGTSGGNASEGMQEWLDIISDVDGLVVNDHLDLDGYTSNHHWIGKSLCGGRIGTVSFGRYDVIGDFKGIPVVDRDGGHCTTAVKVRRNGASRELWVRDPATDEGDDTVQSNFVNDIWTLTDLTVIIMPGMTMKTMTAINYTPGQSPIRLIDGHRTLTPAACFSWNSSLGAAVLALPTTLLNPTLPPPTHFPSPTGAPILSLAWQDLSNELLAVCTSEVAPPTLHAIDPLTGNSRLVPTGVSPTLVATGRSDNVYLCTVGAGGAAITMIRVPLPSPPPPAMTPRPLPNVAHAMAYDDARDDIALVSRTDRKLMRISRTLAGTISVLDIPTFVPMGTGGRIQIAINPNENGIIYLWSDASTSIWRLAPPTTGTLMTATALSLPAAPLPRSLDFTQRGNMLVSNNGTLVEFEPASAAGTWAVRGGSVFAGLPAAQHFRVMRSRTNFEPGVHDTPGWTTNIDASTLEDFPNAPDCLADIAPYLNIDNVVNVSDLLAVISGWGPCVSAIQCVSDINDDNTTNVTDLLAVISAWGACP